MTHTPDVPAERERDELRERLATTLAALVALRDVVRDTGKLNGMEYDALGVQVNRAIAEAEAALLARQEAPAEGISLSAQLSQAAAWMRVWDECQRLGMDTYGAPSTRTGLDIVLDFIRGRAAPQDARADDPETDGTDFAHPAYFRGKRDGIRGAVDALERVLDHGRRGGTFGDERLQAFAARLDSLRAVAQGACEPEALVAALRAIVDMEPDPFDFPADWDQQVAACEECKRWKNHPIQQGICDTHRQPLWDRDAHVKSEQRRLHYRMRSVAREALDAYVLAAARPAPETREPVGWLIDMLDDEGNVVSDLAHFPRFVPASEGRPAHGSGFLVRALGYIEGAGAPAPAEATEASGEMVGWPEVAEPCTDPFHFRLDGPAGAQQCPRCDSRMKMSDEDDGRLRFTAREWLRAWHKAGARELLGAPAPCPCGDGPGHGDAWCGDYECPTCGRGPELDEAIFQAGVERGRADMAPAEATEADSPKWAARRIAELAERDFERVNTPAAEATEPSAPEGATWGDVRSGLRAELIAEGMPITEATRIARKVVHRFSAAEATEGSEP